MQCIFCKIIRGEAKAEILFENEYALSILDINPIHYGHALIFPKQHCETFLTIEEQYLTGLAQATQVVSKAIVNAFQPDGFNIFSNNGKAAGQSVFHFHFHVTPRYNDDNIKFLLELKKYGQDEMNEYANRLRLHIKSNSVHNH